MPHATDDNASSSASENCNADSVDKIEDSDEDGSEQPSPSLFLLQQADENADSSEDDDSEDNQSKYGSIPDLCQSEDEEDRRTINHPNQLPRHHVPERYRKNPCSRNFLN
jgi:hypothetical protein